MILSAISEQSKFEYFRTVIGLRNILSVLRADKSTFRDGIFLVQVPSWHPESVISIPQIPRCKALLKKNLGTYFQKDAIAIFLEVRLLGLNWSSDDAPDLFSKFSR